MKVIESKSKRSLYLQSEIKGYKNPNGIYTGGSTLWHRQNLERLSKIYDLAIIKDLNVTYFVKDSKWF